MSSTRFEGEIIVSAIDKREYRHITLPNKLQALLVHDPKTEKSSACCDVLVGALSDPKEAQGLAHFLEHMLFMGTEKYPVENAYSAYLNSHGGFSNAYTSQENTVYYFDVQNDHIEGALDMFASFFTCPLLSDSSTAREINAVDSENTKNLQVHLSFLPHLTAHHSSTNNKINFVCPSFSLYRATCGASFSCSSRWPERTTL